MAEHMREERGTTVVERRGLGAGGVIGILVLALIVVAAILLATGF